MPPDRSLAEQGQPGRLHARRLAPHSWLAQCLRPVAEAVSGVASVRRIHDRLPSGAPTAQFIRAALDRLGVEFRIGAVDPSVIPERGALTIVANHPFGALDGLLLLHQVLRRRSDVRVLANSWLAAVPQIAHLMLPIDVFAGRKAGHGNALALRRALRWVRAGGALVVFPAGEVSHLQPAIGCIADPDWGPAAARFIRMTGAPVVPVHFSGHNSVPFQVAGLVHGRLRTALLAHELLNKRGHRLDVRVGRAIDAHRVGGIADDDRLARYLRMRTYALAAADSRAGRNGRQAAMAVVDEQPVAALQDEIARLGESARLAETADMIAYSAVGSRIPHLLQEIGRLRELSFRAVGEGTGRAADIDLYDDYYDHLFIWSKVHRRVAGSYRIGRADRILARFGRPGLYSTTLFEFRRGFLENLGPALELGRSFIRAEHQREYSALHLLWKGIGEYVRRDPRYCRLFGAVSISNDYSPASQALMCEFLARCHAHPAAARAVRGRHAVRTPIELRPLMATARHCRDFDELTAFISDIEPDRKGVPVLLRQYLKLGGRTLGFNRDPAFADSIDCLLLVDLRDTRPQLLQRYIDAAGIAAIRRVTPAQAPGLALRA
jgi:putative hemolysin